MIRRTWLALIAAAWLLAPSSALAQSSSPLYWDITGAGAWSTPANWNSDPNDVLGSSSVPGATNDAVFSNTGFYGDTTVQLDAAAAAMGLYFNNTGATLLDSSTPPETLSIGADGITVASTAGAVTLGDPTDLMPISITGSQAWTNNSTTNALTVVSAISETAASTLSIAGAGSTNISGAISNGTGTLGLTMSGSGTLTLSGANSYTGATTITNGTLIATETSGTPFGTGGIVMNSGTLSVAPSGSGANVALTDAGTFAIDGGGILSLNNGSNSSLTFTVGTSGTVLTRGTGGTLVISESVAGALGSTTASGGEQFIINGAAPPNDTLNSKLINLPIVVQHPDGTADFLTYGSTGFVSTATNYSTYSVTFTPFANEIADITANLTLPSVAGATNYTIAGLVVAPNVSFTGSASTNTTNHFLYLNNTAGDIAPVILDSNANIVGNSYFRLGFGASEGTVYVAAGTSTISAVVAGTAGFTKYGPGTLQFTQTNSTTGPLMGTITVDGGLLSYSADGQLSATNNVVLNGGGLQATAGFTTAQAISLGAAGGIIDVSPTFTLTDNAVVSGAGSLTKTDTGTLILDAAETYTGPTTVSAGALTAGVASVANTSGAFGKNSAVTLANATGVVLNLNNFNTQIGSLAGGGSTGGNITLGTAVLTDVQTTSTTFAGVISSSSNTGGLTMNGTGGTLILTAAETYTGPTTVSAGTLQIGAAGSLNSGSYAGAIADSGTFQYSSSVAQTLSGIISGAGALTKDTSGSTLTLSNANTYTGATTIAAGILSTGTAGTLANGGTASSIGKATNAAANLVLNGGTLQYTNTGAAESTDRLFTLGANGGTLDASGANSIAFNGNGSGSANAIAFSGSNTSPTLTLTGSGTGVLAPIIGNNGSGATTLAKTGAGAWTLSGANTYTGATTISQGTLNLTGSLGNTAVGISGGTLTGSGDGVSTDVISNGITLASGSIDFSKNGLATTTAMAAASLAVNGGSFTFNLGSTNTDEISLGSGALTGGSLLTGNGGSGTVTVNINGLPGASTNGTYNLVAFGSESGLTVGVGGNLTLGTTPAAVGTTYSLAITGSGGAGDLELVVTGPQTPSIAYWTGAQAGAFNWGDSNGANTNWSIDSAGATSTAQFPGGVTDVVFAATSASGASLSNNLEKAYAVNSLTILGTGSSSATTGTAVTIGGGSSASLTIFASNNASGENYAAGTGIVIQSGAAGLTISTTGGVIASSSQSWTNNSASAFLVSSNVNGSAASTPVTLTLSNTAAGGTTLSGTIADGTGSGNPLAVVVNNTGAGVTLLSGPNTYSGGTTVSAGTLRVSGSGKLGATSGALTVNSTLDLDGTSQAVGNLTGSSGTILNSLSGVSTLTIGSGNNGGGNFAGVIEDNAGSGGTVALVKTGSAAITLSGNNTYSGGTTLSAGTLNINSTTALGAAAGAFSINGGTIDNTNATGTLINNNPIAIGGSFAYGGTNPLNLGAGAVSVAGSDTITLNGNNPLTLGGTLTNTAANGAAITTTVNNGTGTGSSTALNLAAFNLANTGNTTAVTDSFNGSGSINIAGPVANGGSGASSLTYSGTGTLTLGSTNTYGGATNIGGGALALIGSGLLPTATTVNFTGNGTLNIGSISQTIANLTVANGFTGTVNGSGGTLTLGSGNFNLGGGVSGTAVSQTLNLAGLSNFVYSSGGTFTAAGQSQSSTAPLTLALTTNTITASSFNVGTGAASDNPSPRPTGTVSLGQTNTINASTIEVGGGKGNGTLSFQSSGLTSGPSLTIRGAAGGSTRATSMTVGEVGGGNAILAETGLVDLTTGVTNSTLDALIGTLTIGLADRGGSGDGNPTGTFQFGLGTLDATTIVLGQVTLLSTGVTAAGILTAGAGTVTVQTLTLGDSNVSGSTANGTLNLTGTTLNAQTIQSGATTGSGTRTINFNSGAIANYNSSTNLSISGVSIVLAGAAATHDFTISSGQTGTIGSAISGAAPLTINGLGTVILNGTNTYSGGTTVSSGILSVGTIADTGTSNIGDSGTLTLGGGTLQYTGAGAATTARNVSLTSSSTIVVSGGSSANLTLSGIVSGSGSGLTLGAGSTGTLTLSGNNTYNGGTTISAGTLRVANATGTSATGTGSVTVGSGGVLASSPSASHGFITGPVTVSAGGTISDSTGNPLTLTGGLTFATGSTTSVFNVAGAPGANALIATSGGASGNSLVVSGTDAITLSGTPLAGDTYELISFTGTAPSASSFTLPIAPSGNAYGLNVTSNQVDLIVASSLTWTDNSGSHSWDYTTPNNWAVANVNATYTDGPNVIFNDTNATGGTPPSGIVVVQAGGVSPFSVLFNNATVSYSLSNAGGDTTGITGPTGVTFQGIGTVTFNSPNTYMGTTMLIAGVLVINDNDALGSLGGTIAPLTFNGGTLRYAPGATNTDVSIRSVTINSGGATVDLNGNNVTYANSIGHSGGGALTVASTAGGTLTLQAANTFTGLNLDGGTVNFSSLGNLGTASTIAFNGGTLQWAAPNLDITSGGYSASIGAGGGTLDINGNNVTLAGAIGGSGALTVASTAGGGTLTLGGVNTFTSLTVNGGTLRVAATGSLASSSAVSVNSGAALAGAGSIGGPVSVASSGVLAPSGIAGPNTQMNLADGLTLSSGSVLQFNISNGGSDLINVTGSVTLNTGSLKIYSGGGFLSNGDYPLIDDYAGSITGDDGSGWTVTSSGDNSGHSFSFIVVPSTGMGVPNQFDLVVATANGSSTWIHAGDSNYNNAANWDNGSIPNSPGLTASFASGDPSGSITSPPATIAVDNDLSPTLGTLTFDNASVSYTLNGGTVTLDSGNGSGGAVNVVSGSHQINSTLILADGSQSTTFTIAAGSTLGMGGAIDDSMSVAGQAITLVGGGELDLYSPNTYSGGTTVTSGSLVVADGSNVGTGGLTLNGSAASATFLATSANPMSISGSLEIDNGGTLNMSSNDGSGTLTVSGQPILNSGAINVTAGTLVFTNTVAASGTGAVTVTVNQSATLELAGSASALTSAVTVINHGSLASIPAGSLQVTGGNQTVGVITGAGTLNGNGATVYDGDTVVSGGANLTATQILQNTLTINAGSTVTIAPAVVVVTAQPAAQGSVVALQGSASGATTLTRSVSEDSSSDAVPASSSASDPFTAIQAAIASGSITSAAGQRLESRIAAIESLATSDPGLDASLLESRVLAVLPPSSIVPPADSSPSAEIGSSLLALDGSAIGSGSALGSATAAFAPTATFAGSPAAVPEPSTLLLAALAGIGLMVVGLRRRAVCGM